jgi:mannose-6-phosphate isomerase-like protein (cupin superfamily)
MPSRNFLFHVLARPGEVEANVARLEKSLGELREDVDTAVRAFVAKNQPLRGLLHPPGEAAPTLTPDRAKPAFEDVARSESGSPDAASEENPTFDLASTYVALAPSGAGETIEVTADFWETIDAREHLGEGRLVAVFSCDADWRHWERHPHGEELLVLLSGRVTMVYEMGGEERSVTLEPERAWLVPRGAWHRAVVHAPGKLLAITYGRETEHRPR